MSNAGHDAIAALKKGEQLCDELVQAVYNQEGNLSGEPWSTILWIGLHSPLAGEFQSLWNNIKNGFKDTVSFAKSIKAKVDEDLLQPALRAGEAWLDGPANVEKARSGGFNNSGWQTLYPELQNAAGAFNDAATGMEWTGPAATDFTNHATTLYTYLNGGSLASPVPQLLGISTQLGTVSTRLTTMQERLATDCTRLIVDVVNGAIQTLNAGLQKISLPEGLELVTGPIGACLAAVQEAWAVVAEASSQARTAYNDVATLLDNMNDQAQQVMDALQTMQAPEARSIPQTT
jgi:hypothetical protein